MRWRFLDAVDELVPGARAKGRARTEFPAELFADHFPGFPVTPGVLCVEIAAQLAGLLVQATVHARSGRWVLPMLASIDRARMLAMVPPRAALEATAELERLRPDGALARAALTYAGRVCLRARLMLAFAPELAAGEGRALAAGLDAACRAQFLALASPWQPSPGAP